MTQLEKRLLKEGFTPQQVERIEAAVAGGTYNIYALAGRVYAEWEKSFRCATKQKQEMAALKRMLRLYSEDEIIALAKKSGMHHIQDLEAVACEFIPKTEFSPAFELQEGWKYQGEANAFAKEAAFMAWEKEHGEPQIEDEPREEVHE